jgi:hypothetical protein
VVNNRAGEALEFTPEVVAVSKALFDEYKDAVEETKGYILKTAARVLMAKLSGPASSDPAESKPTSTMEAGNQPRRKKVCDKPEQAVEAKRAASW